MMDLIQHWRAARRLPELLDAETPARDRARLSAHVGRCGACSRRLRRLERSEALLAQMPRMLFPLGAVGLEPTGEASGRLATLVRWGVEPVPRSPYGPIPAASALAMVGLVLALSVTAQDWAPVVGDMGASTTVAMVMPDSSFYPMTLR